MNASEYFHQLYYSACGKPSKYREREDQVMDAYYLVSMLQGINLFSLMFLIFALFSISLSSKIILFGIFCLPLILNYFFFVRKGKKRIIKKVDELIKANSLKPKSYLIWYAFTTIILMALSGILYNISQIPTTVFWIRDTPHQRGRLNEFILIFFTNKFVLFGKIMLRISILYINNIPISII